MISVDTNILFPALEERNPNHPIAFEFLTSLEDSRDDVVISEFILLELHVLLRNPAVTAKPMEQRAAVAICESFRNHPRWQVIGFPPDTRRFHDEMWPKLTQKDFARRRAYDWRTELSLLV